MGYGDEMNNVVLEAKSYFVDASKKHGFTTGGVREVSSKLFRTLDDKSIDNVLYHCESLLNERDWALDIIAYDWAYRVKKQYNDSTFYIFERWLKEYVRDWSSCDDFCTHAFGELLSQNNELFTHILKWTEHFNYLVRRAAAVILIYPIKRGKYQAINPFQISDALMYDEHYLVLKGYGWLLKVLSEKEPHKVCKYLELNKASMPRIAFRYALEKLDHETKLQLMK